MHRIRLARHIGVPPDWFDGVHPAWEDAADIALMLDQRLAQGPERETWQRGSGKPLLLD